MTKSPEQLDEFIRQAQSQGDVSAWQKNPEDTGLVNIVSILNNVPKADIPKPNLLRIRNRVLDKISLPAESGSESFGNGFLSALPRILRVAGGIVGAFTIMLSMTIGTAVAALESVPGQTIYPVKRIVESVQLRLASGPEQKTNLKIKFANNRVDEMEAILQKQKEGKASDKEVQKVVADAMKGIQETSEAVADQSKDQPQVALLTKIVTLTDKQAAVISAAQAGDQPADPNHELDKALEASQNAKELAIENIERAGLVLEAQPMTITEPVVDKDAFTTQGTLTYKGKESINIGNSQILVTEETKYAKITFVDLEAGAVLKVTAKIQGKYTYASLVELISPAPKEEPVKGEEKGAVEGAEQQVPAIDPDTEPVPPVPQ